MNTFKTNLRILRDSLLLTQKGFGEKIGLKREVVQSYEDGRAEPSLATIKKIVDNFGIDDLYLFLYK